MTDLRRLIFAVFAAACAAAPAMADTIIHAGTLLAVPGQPPLGSQSITVRDGRIIKVSPGYAEARAGEDHIIDLRDAFVLPGLIDLHAHITTQWGERRKLEQVTLSEADRALLGAHQARLMLEAGFTTVRNLGVFRGGPGNAIFALRDAILAGTVPGPRIIAAGQAITASAGHSDTLGLRGDVAAALPTSGLCDGADDCRRAVRLQVKRGADVIKVTATGGVMSEIAAGNGQQFTDAELAAIVETAHALGRRVTAHAQNVGGIRAAIRAGVDSIEHGARLDQATVTLFKETGTWLVPTLLAPVTALEGLKGNTTLPRSVIDKAMKLGPKHKESVALSWAAGVPMAFGTDAGVSHYGDGGREFVLLTEIGMTPMEAIVTATLNAAAAQGLSDELGTIEAGKAADIVATGGNPLDDISALTRIRFVMRAGTVYKGKTP